MRFLVILICALCTSCANPATRPRTITPTASTTATAQQQFYLAYEKDRVELMNMTDRAPHQELVDRWQDDLNRLRPYLEQELPKLQGKTLHVIFQYHVTFEENNSCIRDSQKHVAEKLAELQPKLLMTEGNYYNAFSSDALMDEVNQSTEDMATCLEESLLPETPKINAEVFTELCAQNAVFDYAYRHPECLTVGSEWRGVHTLDAMLLWPNAPRDGKSAFDAGTRIRSWMTAARASEFMRHQGLNEATIVIGAYHEHDFERLSQTFGVNVTFYTTHVHKQ